MNIAEQIAAAQTAIASPVVTAAPEAAAEPTPAKVLTRSEVLAASLASAKAKQEALTKQIEALTIQLANVDKLDNITRGTKVQVSLGRAETARTEVGVVAGVKVDDKGGKKFKVVVGQEFDTVTEVVNESQILAVL